MIIGVGIDIIEIERIKEAMENESLLGRIFTPAEIKYFERRKYNPSTIAGSFASKEALVKALGTGIGKVSWHDIEVLRCTKGRPYIKLYGEAKKVFMSFNGERIHVSISHNRKDAIAQVILEG